MTYFPIDEVGCKDGCGMDITKLTRVRLDALRTILQRPLNVTSGARCASYNAKIPGSAKNSRHMNGDAVDISIVGWSTYDIVKLTGAAIQAGARGVGVADTFVHIDFRPALTTVFWKYD